MSPTRGEVMQAVASQELSPDYRRWLAEHPATDAEGFQVLASFAPDEPAVDVFREINEYDHPIIVATVIDGQLLTLEIGDVDPDEEATDQFTLTDASFTVAQVFRAAMAAGHGVIVQFEPARRLIASP